MKNGKLIKVRCISKGSSSIADWYKEIALYQFKDLYWVTNREFNTMGEFLPTEEAFPKIFKNIEDWLGKGVKYPSKFQAANELLGYNWSTEDLQFKETHNTWGSLKNFLEKRWDDVDPHLKPTLKKLISFHSPEKVIINGKETTLFSIKGSTTKLAFLDGNLFSEWRPFRGGTYFSVFSSVNLEVDGWIVRTNKETLESLYK